jgi:hypothetical protein
MKKIALTVAAVAALGLGACTKNNDAANNTADLNATATGAGTDINAAVIDTNTTMTTSNTTGTNTTTATTGNTGASMNTTATGNTTGGTTGGNTAATTTTTTTKHKAGH